MPILDYSDLHELIDNGDITAITLDTCIFDQKNLRLHSASLQVLARLGNREFCFILTKIVCNEVLCHLEKAASEALKSARDGIGKAVGAFGTKKPTRKELLYQITGGRSPKQNALDSFTQYVKDSNCKILDDAELVDTRKLFHDYFAEEAPFGTNKDKSEFPDALALNALEQTAIKEGVGILVISNDGGWSNFCKKSKYLYYVTDLNKSLVLIANAPPVIKKFILKWLEDNSEDNDDLQSTVSSELENAEIEVYGNASYGQCRFYTWAAELKGIIWPEEDKIDIIQFKLDESEDYLQLVLNMPLHLSANIPIEVNFFIWDGIDREEVSMGGRTIEVEDEVSAQATIFFGIYNRGTANEEIIFQNIELEIEFTEIDLGHLDVFEDSDIDEV